MIDELLDENAFRGIVPDRQHALIAAHCKGIVGMIVAAQSSDQAMTIVRRACDAFEKECSSPIVRRALADYLVKKQKELWKSKE